MKKLYIILIAAGFSSAATAQSRGQYTKDSDMPRWEAELNLLGGGVMQNINTASPNYINGVNLSNNKTTFANGAMFGGDVQLGFFFGEKRHWGIGTGLLYMRQMGDLKTDNFHAEYQSTDYQGHTFRQVVSGNGFSERINTDNFNIPVLLKYKNRFSKHWGFAADAGALINVGYTSTYKTNASFDYEAIYQITHNGDGSFTYSYDPSAVPADRDWLITRNQFVKNNPEASVQDYFNGLRAQGYNVGLGITPASTTGTVTHTAGSLGFMVQPSMNYFFSDNVALNMGIFYAYQPFTTTTTSYRLTNNTGEYSSLLNGEKRTEVHSLGLNVGVHFFMGKKKDADHDGVADRDDRCPNVWGLAKFQGCPDRDGDGVVDMEDSCVDISGLAQFHGCPDHDGDGVADKYDQCPDQAGLMRFNGCPDTDGDGVADKYDLCPTQSGMMQFNGCPDTDGDGLADNSDNCPAVAGPMGNRGCPLDTMTLTTWSGNMVSTSISEPILFELNKATIHKSSYSTLEKAVEAMSSNSDLRIVIDGHTDNTGSATFNNSLSLKRAQAVKNYLIKLGADRNRLKAVGHGSRDPLDNNDTPEGRLKNRRAVMRVKK